MQPKIAGAPGSLGKASSAAMRRASYAERDLNRERDPGALDFTAEDDEVDEEEELAQPEEGGEAKSLQRARTILQKRSEIPGDGEFVCSIPYLCFLFLHPVLTSH